MAWTIEFSINSEKQLAKIERFWQQKIISYLKGRVEKDPIAFGKSLSGNLKGLWRYRVGDCRIICELNNKQLTVLVVDVGHRKGVYEK